MFVIELIYKADLAEIDAQMPAHVAFLKKYYAAGNSWCREEDPARRRHHPGGRQEPAADRGHRPGRSVLAHGLADVRIIEFRASQRADDIQRRIDKK